MGEIWFCHSSPPSGFLKICLLKVDVLNGFLVKGIFKWKNILLMSFVRFILAKILPIKSFSYKNVINPFFPNIAVTTMRFFLLKLFGLGKPSPIPHSCWISKMNLNFEAPRWGTRAILMCPVCVWASLGRLWPWSALLLGKRGGAAPKEALSCFQCRAAVADQLTPLWHRVEPRLPLFLRNPFAPPKGVA